MISTEIEIGSGGMMSMKAAVVDRYGPPEVIQVKEIEIPKIKDDEILVKVHASSINTIETSGRSGVKALFGFTRIQMGIRKPKITSTGVDVSGEVIKVGKDISKFKVGDNVFGLARTGSAAEFAKASERGVILKPDNITHTEAAAIPIAGLTALQYLRDLGNVRDGQDVLIYGASGGIGTYAVQYAKTFDLNLTAVCSGKNTELVESLGADRVIDYTQTDFTKLEDKYDIIFDTVGKAPQWRWKKALKDKGLFLQAGSPYMRFTRFFAQILGNKFRKKKMKFTITQTRVKDLELLANLANKGKIKSVIDKTYSLDEIVQAHRHYETGRTVGKVIVQVIPQKGD